MNAPRALLATLTLLFALAPRVGADEGTTVYLTKEEALQTVFAGDDQVLELRQLLDLEQTERIEALLGGRIEEGGFYTYIGLRDGRPSRYAAVVSQLGKVKPITHIVEVLPDGSVGTVAVMIYRESHGAEVADDDFVAQYRGKSLADPIRIDFDVINIAGATLSGHALSRGVRKSLAVVTTLFLEASEDQLAARLALADEVTPPGLASASELVAAEAGHLRLERKVMGTSCAIEAYAAPHMSEDALHEAVAAALDEVQRWDAVLSDWNPETPLSRLSLAPVDLPQAVPAALADWLADASRWAAATDGAFDPTVGALVDAWGLRSRSPARPGRMSLRAARDACGMASLELDRAAGTATRRHAGLRLDPGASGKGWALDRAAEILEAHGVERALLSFRSTLKALGPPPGQQGWEVPVVHDAAGQELTRIDLAHHALSVSGGGLRSFLDGEVQRGHVIDPRSGEPVPAGRLAWVLHSSAGAADALSTALLVAGSELTPLPAAAGGFLTDADANIQSWGRSP